jgi:bifunctional DNA-binding transcriptional regulator/antitoxin component of YhaV-PrlF toxin-antitoxin module
MNTFSITTAGQITLTKELLEHLGVQPGDDVIVDTLPNGRIELRARPKRKISDTFGMLKRKRARTLSINEINDTIARGWAGKR